MDFTEFNHFSIKPVLSIETVNLDNDENTNEILFNFGLKPPGLYFAPNDDWIDWCYNAGFSTGNYTYKQRISKIIKPEKILIVPRDRESVLKFLKKWTITPNDVEESIGVFISRINWKDIMQEYGGIFLPSIKDMEYLTIPGGLIFSALDVDTLVIFEEGIVELDEPEYNEKGYLQCKEEEDDSFLN